MYCSAYWAIGHSVAVTTRKISVKVLSTSDSAISFGVRWRDAPSTSAIMRSRNDFPAAAVMRTRIASESTRVPPVTPERSPPASRTTGADSPVMADSSMLRNALDDLAVAGDELAGLDDHQVAVLQFRGRNGIDERLPIAKPRGQCARRNRGRIGDAQPPGGRFLARLAQRVGLGLAASLGQRLREVGEQDRQEQPARRAR